ncbi:MAG: hypothetical protein JXB07_09855 [Anaerolineae bacterium]|nr:hypothetical protein [Anaerolineae bacterium]
MVFIASIQRLLQHLSWQVKGKPRLINALRCFAAEEIEYSDTESLFALLWEELRHCNSPSEFQECQDALLEAVIRTELSILDIRENIKQIKGRRRGLVAPGTRPNKGTIRLINIYQAHQDELEVLEQEYLIQLGLLHMLGDTLAWHFIPEHILRAMYQAPSPGFITGEEGAILELQIIEVLRSKGFILMHDLTSILRVGDLSIHGSVEFDGVIIEAKKSQHIAQSAQSLRQQKRLERLEDFSKTGVRKLEDGTTVVTVSPPDFAVRYEWQTIEGCLKEAKANGLALLESSDGLALYMGATQEHFEEITRNSAKLHQALAKVSWDKRLHSGVNFYDITAGRDNSRFPTLMPLTVMGISPQLVTDLLFKRLILLVMLDHVAISNSLAEIRSQLGAKPTDKKDDGGWYLEDINGHRLDIGVARVYYEGLSPSSFLEICMDMFHKSIEIVVSREGVAEDGS